MKALASTVLLLSLISFHTAIADSFPHNPIEQLTPGTLCNNPDKYRYPEKIAYCERDVSTNTKKQVMQEYDRRFGFRTTQMSRRLFKIDHYIPLCMGGSNETSNLWPQHESVYNITDPLEEALCTKMAEGKILQKEAIALMKEAKAHLDEAPGILRQVRSL